VTDRLPSAVYVVFQWCRIEFVGGLLEEGRKTLGYQTGLGVGEGVENFVSNYASKTEVSIK